MRKIISVLLAGFVLLCGTTVAFAGSPMFENPDPRAVYLYDYPGEQNPVQLKEGDTYGMYMMVDKPFSEVQINCPSWSNNIGSMTLSFYKWEGSYASTVKTQPISKETFVDYEDNEWLKIKGPEEGFAAGEYLWVLSDPVESVGVWKADFDNMETSVVTESFKNGEPIEGLYVTCIVYAGQTVNAVQTADKFNVLMYVDSKKAYVRGNEITLDVPATVVNGRTLVPARFVAESIGAEVLWDEETQTVTIKKDGSIVTLVIDSDEMNVNGKIQILDVPATVINYRTLVPLRAIVEALGQQASYFADGSKGLIVVGPNAAVFSKEKVEKMLSLYR